MSGRPTAVVTGGAGFIGSHAVDYLVEHGYRVRVIDNLTGGHESNLSQHRLDNLVDLVQVDIRSLDQGHAAFRGAELVLHFAGIGDIVPSIEQPTQYMDVNTQGTVRVLECARQSRVGKVVYASSSSCFGLAETPTAEDAPIDPRYPYALSKHLGEQAVLHWNQVYGLPVNCIRIFNAYGPRVRTTGAYGAVFGVFLRQKLAGAPLTVVGDGTQARDFVYVTDVARAFVLAAQRGASGRVFNLGAGSPQTINRLVEIIGGDVVYVPRRPGEPQLTWADTTRIRTELGWAPLVSFEDGVQAMLEDIGAWADAPLWNPETIAEATRTWFAYLSDEEGP